MRGISAFVAIFVLATPFAATSPASSATDPLCENFRECPQSAGEFTLTPSPQSMNVAWKVTAPSTTVCWRNLNINGKLWDQCTLVGYRVTSTFDPVTKTGGQARVTVDLEKPNCTFTGLVNGVQYQFSAQAVYGINGSTPLNQQLTNRCFIGSGLTSADCQFQEGRVNAPISGPSSPQAPCCDLPLAPTEVTTAVLRNSVDVSWQAPTNWGGAPELTYTVTATPGGATCTTVGLTCRLDGLGYGSTYAISVTGANAAGFSPPATGSATVATGVPDTPTVTKVTYLPGGKARVTWKPPVSDGGSKLTGYTIASTPGKARCTAKTSARTCDVTGLTGGRRYAFSATAVNAKGASTPSAPVAAGVLVGPASKPRDVAATLDGTRATVTWNPPSSNGGGKVISYVVRSVPAGLECTTPKQSCSMNGLARGRSYTFDVYAVNTSGRGQPATSNAVLAPAPIAPAPPAAPPSKPTAPLS